ncbi:MAG: carboxypeptidase-like regulatory domain-containing protein [Cyanobacteriota bacterium]|nr:carboxypeptidase-like regulatory domain-containing protein [Cyanobacteriota bacterium]
MTPLPPPMSWPSGEALGWARARSWEALPALGSIALQPVPHRVDEETLVDALKPWFPREAIPDLLVRCQGSRLRPTWHGANGLYGFVGLAPGQHTFTIEDPLGRFLPARITLNVADRPGVMEALRQAERPSRSEDWRQLVHRLGLRPAPGAPARSGSTAIWGQVCDGVGQPIPHALVRLSTRLRQQPATATTWSDASGAYALDLDGERSDPLAIPADAVERQGWVWLPLAAAVSDPVPWIERQPEFNANLLRSLDSGAAPAGYGPPRASGTDVWFRDGPGGAARDRARLRIGRRQRWDLVVT